MPRGQVQADKGTLELIASPKVLSSFQDSIVKTVDYMEKLEELAFDEDFITDGMEHSEALDSYVTLNKMLMQKLEFLRKVSQKSIPDFLSGIAGKLVTAPPEMMQVLTVIQDFGKAELKKVLEFVNSLGK